MPSAGSFRLSLYLTLSLACAAIGYAEAPLLFEVPFIAGAVIVSLAVLYRLETRVELLAIPAANRLGLVLGLANIIWMVFRILRELDDPRMPNTDWGVLVVAMCGPLAMIVMPAKLARREKHAGDYWLLHGLALAAAALAAAMADDPLALVLIGAYAGCAIWNLVAFSLLCAAGSIRPIPGHGQQVRAGGVVGDGSGRSAATVAVVMALAALVATIPLYLITPRSWFQKLEFGKPRVEIGFAADQMVDLTQTGTLRGNDNIAFEVIAETDTGRKLELSPEQRWRGAVKGRYQAGKWPDTTDFKLPAISPAPLLETIGSLPALWPNQMTLTFAVPGGGRNRFLADPIRWVGGQPAPVLSASQGGYRTWVWGGNGSFIPDGRQRGPTEIVRYTQLWHPHGDGDLSTPFELIDLDIQAALQPLRQNPVPRVKQYADGLIDEMVRDHRLPANHYDRVSMLPRPEFHDAIARAFSAHLATTPTLSYTTELRRSRKDIDPVEDFLFHTRAGHCERFATALVLMLRSQGVPAVLVLGFKGCEPTDEPGKYIVRHSHAHAWVEALIEDFRPRPWWDVTRPSRWRSLDPTPSGSAASAPGGGWLDRSTSRVRRLYNTYVVEYTPEQRLRAIAGMVGTAVRWEVLTGIAAVIIAVWIWRSILQLRRAAARATRESRWFDRLLGVLAPYGYELHPSETAQEFAIRVAEILQQRSRTAPAAEIPLEWSEAYYESRFGGQALSESRRAELDARLDVLRDALAARRVETLNDPKRQTPAS
jgi:protein-glutamine gamma-glutamyltransferase